MTVLSETRFSQQSEFSFFLTPFGFGVTFFRFGCLIGTGGDKLRHDVIEDLFLKYYNDALLYTLSLTKNCPLAEEIVSDAFYTALKTADDEVHNFKAWLLKVCRNLYLNSLRKSRRTSELDENLADESEGALDKIIRKEEYKALYHAVSVLNPSYKEAVTLFYFEDLSIRDIAMVTGKSETVVKVTLFRAREALKKILSASL